MAAIEDLRQAITPRESDLSFLWPLANLLRERGATTVVMQDMSRIAGVSFDMPMAQLSAMMDNVLHPDPARRDEVRPGRARRLPRAPRLRAEPPRDRPLSGGAGAR